MDVNNIWKKMAGLIVQIFEFLIVKVLNVTLYVLLYCIFQTAPKASPWRSGSCIKTTIFIHAYPFERSRARYLISSYSTHTVRSTLSCSCRPCLHKIKQVRGSAVHAIIHAGASVHGRLTEREAVKVEGRMVFCFLTQEMHHDVDCHT